MWDPGVKALWPRGLGLKAIQYVVLVSVGETRIHAKVWEQKTKCVWTHRGATGLELFQNALASAAAARGRSAQVCIFRST